MQRIFPEDDRNTGLNPPSRLDSALFESSPDCMTLLDLDGNILAVNQNGLRAMEIDDPGRVLHLPWTTLWPAQSHRAMHAALESACNGLSGRFNGFCHTAMGTPKWWDVIVTPIRAKNGRVERLLAMSRDVTAAYCASEELQASRERFALLLQLSGEGVYGVGPDNQCIFINRTGAGILGYESDELVGRQLHDLILSPTADGSCHPLKECHLGEVVAKGVPVCMENEVFWRKDGTSVAVSYTVAPLIMAGVQAGAVVTFSDVTQRRQTEKALRQSEERLQLATDAAELGLWTWNRTSDEFTWENNRPCDIVGLPPSIRVVNAAEFVATFLHAEDMPVFERAVCALDSGGRLFFQGRVRRTDGVVRWVEFSGRRQSESEDAPSVVVGTIADISDRKRSELGFFESRERLEKILSQAAAGVVQADVDGKITLANQKYGEMLGYAETDLIGMSITDVTAPGSVQQTRAAIKALAAGGPGFTIDKQYRRKDGSLIWATTSVNMLRSQDGRYQGMVAIVIDIDERIQAEQALRHSENQLQFVLDSIPQKIFTTTPLGNADYFNPAWANFTGVSFETILNWGWTIFIHPDDLEENIQVWRQAVESGEPFEFTHRFRNAAGEFRWHLSRALPCARRQDASRCGSERVPTSMI